MAKKGGKREGAGRKEGTANKRTREIADKAIEQGISPLEVMLEAMRFHYDKAQEEGTEKGDHLKAAAAMAEKAAPYIHPRLAPVDKDGGPQKMVVEIVQYTKRSTPK
jgi:hypothetical protein